MGKSLRNVTLIIIGLVILTLSACTTPPPRERSNICSIFKQYPEWYWAALDSYRHWHVPVAVQMAIINQESAFRGNAKPPRQHLLWVIPWTRPSSAYGYSQALKGTWRTYQHSAHRWGAERDEFTDAVDFVGWYGNQAQHQLGIAKNDPYRLYLAYHEGLGGYSRKTYLQKAWLIYTARRVKLQSMIYARQYQGCQATLATRPWYRFWA